MSGLLLALAGLAALVVGAEVLVRGAVDLALRARVSPLVVGLTVVSMGTSAPELLVSLVAAMEGSPDIAIGNVVGSNIANISLVLGLSVLVFPIEVDREARRLHWPVMMATTLLFWALVRDGGMARWEGAVLVALLMAYVAGMVRASRRSAGASAPASPSMAAWKSLAMLVVGMIGLSFGAEWFVAGASTMAREAGVSEQTIGLTIVAVGTSLPELVTSLVAAFRKQPDISLGNLVGSNIFNLLGIIGFTAAVLPIRVDYGAFRPDLAWMAGIALLLLPMMLPKRMVRWQGLLLFAAYAAYIGTVLVRA